jgi:hypothetical protein
MHVEILVNLAVVIQYYHVYVKGLDHLQVLIKHEM